MAYKGEKRVRSDTARLSMPQPAKALQVGDGFFTKYLWLSHTQANGLRFFQKHFPATRDIFGLLEEKE